MLQERGTDWPAPLDHFASLPSTSDHLKGLAQQGASEWTVVLAERQTAGRGRQGKVWVSSPGGLYMSILLRPTIGLGRLGLLPLAAGVAVAEALSESGVEAQLKWPNDVLIGGRKVAGILAEGSSGSRGADWVVLGLGINLAPPEGLPESATATSLLEEGRPLERLTLAAAVLLRLTAWYHALVDPQTVLARWRALSAPWWGRMVEVRSGTQRVEGVVRDVDAQGALLLEIADGSLAAIVSGEARELRLRSE